MEKHTLPTTSLPLTNHIISNNPIIKADLFPHIDSQLGSVKRKQHPMVDPSIPYRDLTNVASKKESLGRLIDKLDVAHNLRYQRTVDDTYCNVYAYDYCYYSKVYLPTVWWNKTALEKLASGQEQVAIFGQTVDRIYSSALTDWFPQWGGFFGWEEIATADEIQNKVNTHGGIGIICAKRREKGLSGHIVPIVPETNEHQAYRENGLVVYPLQSQAGKLNYNYFSELRKDWWKDELYSSYVFYYHP
jgi:hypothetical protein